MIVAGLISLRGNELLLFRRRSIKYSVEIRYLTHYNESRMEMGNGVSYTKCPISTQLYARYIVIVKLRKTSFKVSFIDIKKKSTE